MTKMESLKIRAGRALNVFKDTADTEQWEKLVESLEEHAVRVSKAAIEATPLRSPNWWRMP